MTTATLTLLALAMIAVFMGLIMARRLSPLVALILVPTGVALLGGFAGKLGPMMLDGIKALAPTGAMLMFAILYFGIMIDAGLFEPLVRRVMALVQGDPVRILVGTAVLALIVSLDGDGSTTYLITVSALLPLYRRVGIHRGLLTAVIMLASGVMNLTPWGGPTARAASALGIDAGELFVPLVPAMIGAGCWLIALAYAFGVRERRRLAVAPGTTAHPEMTMASPIAAAAVTGRPTTPLRQIANALLTAILLVALVWGVLPMAPLFMLAVALALVINHPTVKEQSAVLAAQAGNVVPVVAVIFAAGIFTGILSGTGMVDALAHGVVALVPPVLGPYLAVITGLLSLPFTFLISNDAFYFGVLPVLAKAAAAYGISAAEIGRASLIGQPVHLLSPLVPSTYLLVGLAEVEFGDHQRLTLKWAALTALVLLAAALVTGVIPWMGHQN
jgi:CitMHS family citrate-Mg2+:H+ or citrate-Ca2+:H+ symporter